MEKIKIAITGGIGSGKSVICKRLGRRGIQVYDCDDAAKRLMRTDVQLQKDLQQLVGEEVFVDGVLQKPVLATYLLGSEAHQKAVGDIVHPAVARDFLASDYSWMESAILFESGFDKRLDFDIIVCVTAPLELRIQRVMERDGITREKTLDWMNRQFPQEEVRARSNYELVSGRDDIEEQIDRMLEDMKRKYKISI